MSDLCRGCPYGASGIWPVYNYVWRIFMALYGKHQYRKMLCRSSCTICKVIDVCFTLHWTQHKVAVFVGARIWYETSVIPIPYHVTLHWSALTLLSLKEVTLFVSSSNSLFYNHINSAQYFHRLLNSWLRHIFYMPTHILQLTYLMYKLKVLQLWGREFMSCISSCNK